MEPSGVANTSQDVDEDDDGADDGGEGDGDETEGMDDDALEVCRASGVGVGTCSLFRVSGFGFRVSGLGLRV